MPDMTPSADDAEKMKNRSECEIVIDRNSLQDVENGSVRRFCENAIRVLPEPDPVEFENPESFLVTQRSKRDKNDHASGGQRVLMLSHCWRNEITQAPKRRIISSLSLNGWSYWADFLDLQASGPVPWRKEIEDGIRDCAKVVLFVDKAYLLSFNCLQEVALAVAFHKPVVVFILDQEAMDLLTQPRGAAEAWSELKPYEGKHLTPDIADGAPLTLEMVSSLFEFISNINVCMCRPLDCQNDTWPVVLRRARDFVGAELAHEKEHALLSSKAWEWQQSNRDPSRLPKSAAVVEYKVWLARAHERKLVPKPTRLQEEYVACGEKRASRNRFILQMAVVLVFLVVTSLAAFAVQQYFSALSNLREAQRQTQIANEQTDIARNQTLEAQLQAALAMELREIATNQTLEAERQASIAHNQSLEAVRQATEAQRQEEIANAKTVEAEVQAELARTQQAIALEKATVATARQYLTIAKGDTELDGYAQAAIREALDLGEALPVEVKGEVNSQVAALGELLGQRTVGYAAAHIPDVPCHVLVAGSSVMALSPDGSRLACYTMIQESHGMLVVDLETRDQTFHPLPPNSLPDDVMWKDSDEEGLELLLVAHAPGWVAQVHRGWSAGPAAKHANLSWTVTDFEAPPNIQWDTHRIWYSFFAAGGGGWVSAFLSSRFGLLGTYEIWVDVVFFDFAEGTSTLLRSYPLEMECFTSPFCQEWSNGQRLVRYFFNGTVLVWDVSDGQHLEAATRFSHPTAVDAPHSDAQATVLQAVGFSPDGERMATRTVDGVLRVWALEASGDGSHQSRELGIAHQEFASDPFQIAWSRDGRRVAMFGGGDIHVSVLDVDSDTDSLQEVLLYVSERPEVVQALWQGDSEHLVVVAENKLVLMRLEQQTRQSTINAFHSAQAITAVQWSHDGGSILKTQADGSLHVWNVTGRTDREVLAWNGLGDRPFPSGSWGPDDAQILTTFNTGITVIINVSSGARDYLDNGILCSSTHATFSHDGAMIAWLCRIGGLYPYIRAGVWNLTRETPHFREFDLGAWSLDIDEVHTPPMWTADDQTIAFVATHWSQDANESFPTYCAAAVFVALPSGDAHIVSVVDWPIRAEQHAAAMAPHGQSMLVFGRATLDSQEPLLLRHVLARSEDGMWMLASSQSLATDNQVLSMAWPEGGATVFTGMADGTVREWDAWHDCTYSWTIVESLQGPPHSLSVLSRSGDADDLPSRELLVTEGTRIRMLHDTRTHARVIRRQSAAVSLENLEARYHQSGAVSVCYATA